MSTHRVEVFKVKQIEDHPNADRLKVIRIHGYSICVRKDEFKIGDLVAYIPVDSVVPLDRPEFNFLDKPRIQYKRLRGISSHGMVIPAPAHSSNGDDVTDLLGIVPYEPPMHIQIGGDMVKPPEINAPIYDIENLQRYPNVIADGEIVTYSEKIHGCNARFVYHNNQQYVGSRKTWLKDGKNIYWKTFHKNEWIWEYCTEHPDHILYAEIYGWVQSLRYGHKQGQTSVLCFGIRDPNGKWATQVNAHQPYLKWVPLLYKGPFNFDHAVEYSNGSSIIHNAGHIREGIVITPVVERIDTKIGKIQLKCVSEEYLRKGK